jgi:hypothetical protein
MKQKDKQQNFKKTYTSPSLKNLGALKELTKGRARGTSDSGGMDSGGMEAM